ncbi:hypothetical protein VU04_08405 [Desulfobulbus sp. TB]|nr:hypothetical protein [Desulfobulbus sp. TB]
MTKLTVLQLKKQLAQKTKEELIKEIGQLYQKFPQVKEFYQAKAGNIDDVLAKYKEIIEKEFIEGKTRGMPKTRFSVARKALNDFKKITKEPLLVADLMLTYVESVSWFNTEFAPDIEEFYTRPEDMFEDTLALLKQHDLLAHFRQRVRNIIQNATEVWGHYDSLKERYEDAYGTY